MSNATTAQLLEFINNPDNWVDFETPYIAVHQLEDFLHKE